MKSRGIGCIPSDVAHLSRLLLGSRCDPKIQFSFEYWMICSKLVQKGDASTGIARGNTYFPGTRAESAWGIAKAMVS